MRRSRQVIELDDGPTVGGISELQPQSLGTGLGLRQPIGRVAVTGFGLDHRDKVIAPVAQDVIRPLLLLAPGLAADGDNPPVGERDLHPICSSSQPAARSFGTT